MSLEDGEIEDVICEGGICRSGVVDIVIGGLWVVGRIDCSCHGGGMRRGGVC